MSVIFVGAGLKKSVAANCLIYSGQLKFRWCSTSHCTFSTQWFMVTGLKSAMHFISAELSPQKLEKITLTSKLLQLWVRGRLTNQSGAGKVYCHASAEACQYILPRIDWLVSLGNRLIACATDTLPVAWACLPYIRLCSGSQVQFCLIGHWQQ